MERTDWSGVTAATPAGQGAACMRALPRSIRDVQGDLWVPAETADLLERVLRDAAPHIDPAVLRELTRLLAFDPTRQLASARDQLGLIDPAREQLARNFTKGG